jgi:hypothetical protein
MIVNNEFESMWKKYAVAYFKILTQYLPEGLRKPMK